MKLLAWEYLEKGAACQLFWARIDCKDLRTFGPQYCNMKQETERLYTAIGLSHAMRGNLHGTVQPLQEFLSPFSTLRAQEQVNPKLTRLPDAPHVLTNLELPGRTYPRFHDNWHGFTCESHSESFLKQCSMSHRLLLQLFESSNACH